MYGEKAVVAEDDAEQDERQQDWHPDFERGVVEQDTGDDYHRHQAYKSGHLNSVLVAQCFFTNVRNIAGNFFLAEFGITSHNFKFFNVKRGQNIIA